MQIVQISSDCVFGCIRYRICKVVGKYIAGIFLGGVVLSSSSPLIWKRVGLFSKECFGKNKDLQLFTNDFEHGVILYDQCHKTSYRIWVN